MHAAWIAGPTRRLVATLLAAVLLAAAGVGLTSLTATADDTSRSGTVTVRIQAQLDEAEVAGLASPDGHTPTAADVQRAAEVLARTSVVLQRAQDGTGRAALRWDDQVAVDVRVDAADVPDLPHGDPDAMRAAMEAAEPFDLTVAVRVDVTVVLQMAMAAAEPGDIGPRDLLDLPERAAQQLPDELGPALGDLLAGRWVSVGGVVDPEAVRSRMAERHASHDAQHGEHGEVVRELALAVEELTRTSTGPDGPVDAARLDLLELLVRLTRDMDHGADEMGAAIDGWQRTTVELVATVTDRGQVASVWADVAPTTSLTFDQLREMHDGS